jgi:zinc protease
LNSFVFNFHSPDQPLSRLLRYEYYDYPADFIFQFQDGVRAATAEAVLEAAQERLAPEDLVVLVVGNENNIQPALTTLSSDQSVTAIDISIPQPGA